MYTVSTDSSVAVTSETRVDFSISSDSSANDGEPCTDFIFGVVFTPRPLSPSHALAATGDAELGADDTLEAGDPIRLAVRLERPVATAVTVGGTITDLNNLLDRDNLYDAVGLSGTCSAGTAPVADPGFECSLAFSLAPNATGLTVSLPTNAATRLTVDVGYTFELANGTSNVAIPSPAPSVTVTFAAPPPPPTVTFHALASTGDADLGTTALHPGDPIRLACGLPRP